MEPHVFELRYGALVAHVAEAIVGSAAVDALAIESAAAVDCATLTSHIAGEPASYEWVTGAQTFGVSSAQVSAACGLVVAEIEARSLGLFAYDTPVELGGSVHLLDDDGDLIVDGLVSGVDYGGLVLAARRAVSPRIEVVFTASAIVQ